MPWLSHHSLLLYFWPIAIHPHYIIRKIVTSIGSFSKQLKIYSVSTKVTLLYSNFTYYICVHFSF